MYLICSSTTQGTDLSCRCASSQITQCNLDFFCNDDWSLPLSRDFSFFMLRLHAEIPSSFPCMKPLRKPVAYPTSKSRWYCDFWPSLTPSWYPIYVNKTKNFGWVIGLGLFVWIPVLVMHSNFTYDCNFICYFFKILFANCFKIGLNILCTHIAAWIAFVRVKILMTTLTAIRYLASNTQQCTTNTNAIYRHILWL